MPARLGAGSNRAENSRPKQRGLRAGGDLYRPARHVRIDLHERRVLLGDTTARYDRLSSYRRPLERLDHPHRPVGGRFKQGSVDLVRLGTQRQPDDQTREVRIDKRRSVPVPPIQCQ